MDAKVASAFVDIVARTASFEKALDDAHAQIRRFSQQSKAEVAEARGSFALLGEEVGVHLPRHLQTFLAELPGVSEAMSAAFNTVAVLALVDIVFKAGEKLAEFFKKNEEAAKKNVEAWESVNKPLVESNDALRVTNDRLENSIAKMEHKPQNGLKLAIDEAIESADKLSSKLDGDLKKIAATLKDSAPAIFGQQLFGGMAPTDDIRDKFENLQGRIRDAEMSGRANLETARGSKDPDAVKNAQAALDNRLSDLYAEGAKFAQSVYDTSKLAEAAKLNPNSFPMSYQTGFNSLNQTSRINASAGLLDYFHAAQDTVSLGAENRTLTGRSTSLTAAQTAAQERLKQIEEDFGEEKRLYGMSVGQERAFWEDKKEQFTKGSEQYKAVEQKFWAASEKFSADFEKIRKSTKGENEAAPVIGVAGVDFTAGVDQLSAAIARHGIEVEKINAQWVEARDKQALATGQMSAHAAAVELAAAHTREYKASIADLQKQLADLQAEQKAFTDAGFAPDKKNLAAQQNIQSQIDRLNAANQITQAEDELRKTGTTWKGMIDSVFNELALKANETQSKIRQEALQFIDGMNTEAAKALTGHKADFGKIFDQASQGLAKTGLEKVEGVLFGGKKGNGYNVYVDNLPKEGFLPGVDVGGGAASKAVSKGLALGLFNDSDFFGKIFGGRLFGAGSIFGGGHAMGGSVMAGVPIDVGEMGVERFTPMVPGRITPNRDMGHGGPLIGYVDARGTDPVLAAANLNRALQQTRAHAAAAAMHGMAEAQKRRAQ